MVQLPCSKWTQEKLKGLFAASKNDPPLHKNYDQFVFIFFNERFFTRSATENVCCLD